MLRKIWYQTFRVYVKIGLFFLMKKMRVYGKHNIPKKGAILFIANHQNALIDALLIPTTSRRNIHFLTRASAFKNKISNTLLRSLNLIPVYRIRDGFKTIEKNVAIFEQCFEILAKEKAIQIFPEGEHHPGRKIIALKKGFARIILGTLQKYPDLDIKIIPVGINFDAHLEFPCSTSLYYGKPINANKYFNVENPDTSYSEILSVVLAAMKELTLHIEDTKHYDEIVKKMNAYNVDYLDPFETNKLAKNLSDLPDKAPLEKSTFNWFAPLHLIAKANSVFPILIWRYLKGMVSDTLFLNTFRFGLILTLFPFFYLMQAGVVWFFFDLKYAAYYLVACILVGIISTKTMRVNPI